MELTENSDYTVIGGGAYTFDPALQGRIVTISYQAARSDVATSALQPLGLSLANGTPGQPVWGYLTTNFAAQAIGYSGLAYVYAPAYDLGGDASIANHSFEVGTAWEAVATGDANPALVAQDLLTNARYGANFAASRSGDFSAWANYCLAQNLVMSPVLDSQKPAAEWCKYLLDLTNTDVTWSQGVLKYVPLGDVACSANGATYAPNVTPIYDLTEDHFLDDGNSAEPLVIERKANDDTYNHIRLEYCNRANQYNTEPMEAKDAADIDRRGLRTKSTQEAHAICDATVASMLATILLQRELGVRNLYKFKLPWTFALLEPLDLVTVTDAYMGLTRLPVRINKINETDAGDFEIEAEDCPVGMASAPAYGQQAGLGFAHDYRVAPGDIVAPVFTAPVARSLTGLEVYTAVNGASSAWGGCRVWVSLDGVGYKLAGHISGGARYGKLTASMLSTDAAAAVSLAGQGGVLLSGSAADVAALSTLLWVDGEYMAYQTATLSGAGAYSLTGIKRAAYYTKAAAHASGADWVRVDDAVASSGPLDPSFVGKTLYFKFTSFNVYGAGEQNLADVMAYSTVVKAAAQAPVVPATPVTNTLPDSGSTVVKLPDLVAVVVGPLQIGFELNNAGQVVLTVKAPADPTIKWYELRGYDKPLFSESALVQVSDANNQFTLALTTVMGNKYRIHAAYAAGGFGLAEGVVSFGPDGLTAIVSVDWTIEEPNMLLKWPVVSDAAQYAVYVEEAGVAKFRKLTANELRIPIPKFSILVRVIAIAADGRVSPPYDKTIGLTGSYKLNEVVNVPVSTTTGTFAGLAHLGGTSVERPDLLGPSSMVFPIVDTDNASLYAFGYNLENTAGTVIQDVSGTWFRNGFWNIKDGYYESVPVDLGAVLTGYVKAQLTKVVEYHGGAGSTFERVLGEYMQTFTAADLENQQAFLSARLYITSDPPAAANWTEVVDGQPVAGRYVRMVVEALNVGPLTRVRVTAGAITLDVPDKTLTGKASMGTTSLFVGLAGWNNVSVVIATPDKSCKVWVTGVTTSGFTLNTDSASFPTVVSYFVKGY